VHKRLAELLAIEEQKIYYMNTYTFQLAHDWVQLMTKWEEAVGSMRVVTC